MKSKRSGRDSSSPNQNLISVEKSPVRKSPPSARRGYVQRERSDEEFGVTSPPAAKDSGKPQTISSPEIIVRSPSLSEAKKKGTTSRPATLLGDPGIKKKKIYVGENINLIDHMGNTTINYTCFHGNIHMAMAAILLENYLQVIGQSKSGVQWLVT